MPKWRIKLQSNKVVTRTTKSMNVWSYWAGPKPKWIDTCLNSIRKQCKESVFRLLTPENVDEYATGLYLPKRWKELPPGVGTDCLRAALLARYGGLWIDADTICIKDPINLFNNRHKENQFLYSRWSDGRAIAGYVYSPKQHPVAMRWYNAVVSALSYAEGIGWGDLGEQALTWILRGSNTDASWEIPLGTFLPVDIDKNVEEYFKVSYPAEHTTDRTIAFGLNHSWMMHNKKDVMESEPTSDLLIHRVLRMGL